MRECFSRVLMKIKHDDQGEPEIVIGRGHHSEIVAEEFRRGDAAEALRTIGDVGRVARHDWHDLAEAERHDGKIITFEPERRHAEQQAEESGDQGRNRQHQPERHIQMDRADATPRLEMLDKAKPLEGLPEAAPLRLDLIGRQRAVGVGADGEERRIAEIEQAGKADDDVEPERQHGIGERIRRRIDVAFIAVEIGEGERRHEDDGEQIGTELLAPGAIPDRRDPAMPAPHRRGRYLLRGFEMRFWHAATLGFRRRCAAEQPRGA